MREWARPTADPGPDAEPARRVPRPAGRGLLALQRTAGNAAVVQRVAAKDLGDAIGRTGAAMEGVEPLLQHLEKVTDEWERSAADGETATRRHEALTTWVRQQLPVRVAKQGKPPPVRKVGKWFDLIEPEMHRIAAEELQVSTQDLKGIDALIASNLSAGVVAPAQRILVECTMAQGVTGDLGRYFLFSGQFSSCSPVVMFNAGDRTAGLFHYAENGRAQVEQLTAMYEHVKPTWIGLNVRPGTKGNPQDEMRLKERLRQATPGKHADEYDDEYEDEYDDEDVVLPTDAEGRLRMNHTDLELLTELFTSLGRVPELIPGAGNAYCVALPESGAKPLVTGSEPYAKAKELNVTAMASLPGELRSDAGLRLFYNAECYSPGFIKK